MATAIEPHSIDWELRLGFLIHDVSRLRRSAFDRCLKPLSVTRSQWWVLAYLSREDGMTQSQLAEELDLGKVAVGGLIDRTTERSMVTVPDGFVPDALQPLQGLLHRVLPWLVEKDGDIVLGPIPKGVPVALLANLKLRAEGDTLREKVSHVKDVGEFVITLKRDLASAPPNASDEELRQRFVNLRQPMLDLSKCPDFVVNRGHYFGTAEFNRQDGLSADEQAFGREPELSDDDKRALIAFLKTF